MSGGNLAIVKSRRREEIAIFNRSSRLAILAGAAALAVANWSSAAVLTWDSSATTPLAPVDGPGTWDTATSNWSDGTNDNVWNNANNDTAVFGNGGAAGTGAIAVTSGGVTVGGITFNAVASGNYNLSGGIITLGAATNNITTNAGSPTITSVMAGSASASLALSGAGTINLLAPADTYGGGTSITSESVNVATGANAAFTAPFGVINTILALSNATISNKGSSSGGSIAIAASYNLTLAGNNTINTGKNFTLGVTADTMSGAGNLTFNNNGTSTANGTSNIKGGFSGTGASAFTGTLTLTGIGGNNIRLFANGGSYLGVPNGTLDLEGTINATPQTNTGGNTFTYGALSGTSTTAILAGGTAGAPTNSIGGLGLSTSFAGTIVGNNAVTLTGGSLTLTNAGNTYTGATNVNGGTLIINGKTTASTTNVGAAGTLAGTGSIGTAATAGAVTVNGTIAPGAAPSTVSVLALLDGLAFGATGTYSDDIDGVGGSDLLAVTGNIAFGAGDTLNVNVPGGGAGGLTYTIATYTGTESGTFAVTNLPPGYAVNYGTGTNSSITIAPASVPEPASAALLGLAAAGLLGRRRRRS